MNLKKYFFIFLTSLIFGLPSYAQRRMDAELGASISFIGSELRPNFSIAAELLFFENRRRRYFFRISATYYFYDSSYWPFQNQNLGISADYYGRIFKFDRFHFLYGGIGAIAGINYIPQNTRSGEQINVNKDLHFYCGGGVSLRYLYVFHRYYSFFGEGRLFYNTSPFRFYNALAIGILLNI